MDMNSCVCRSRMQGAAVYATIRNAREKRAAKQVPLCALIAIVYYNGSYTGSYNNGGGRWHSAKDCPPLPSG